MRADADIDSAADADADPAPGAAGTRFRRLITVFFIEFGRCVPCSLK